MYNHSENINNYKKNFLPQDQNEKSPHRQSLPFRNQPPKDYKAFIPKPKILKKVEFQKTLLN